MHKKNLILFVFIAALLVGCSTIDKLEKRPIGFINNVSFNNPSFNKPNAANGFIVQYKSKTYAITAKHVLNLAKTDKMKFVDFEGELKQWKMHPKNDPSQYVILDQLLNTNKTDSLTWSYMDNNWDNYNDWLVFSIKENKTKHKPLKFRTDLLIKEENMFVIGWSYKDSIGTQRVYEYKFDKVEGNYYNLKQIKGPKSLAGLSGSPVVDKKGNVIGLVTSGWEDEETKEVILQATSMKKALEFITELD
jgi:V8-like Glu-specific endopeptidase